MATAKPHTVIQEYPQGSWLENVVVLPSSFPGAAAGGILTTHAHKPELRLDLLSTSSSELIYTFPEPATSACGIVLLPDSSDVYVAAGGFSLTTFSAVPASGSVWRVDVAGRTATKLADLPDSLFLNGMTATPDGRTLLIADSDKGCVWEVDVATGAVGVAYEDATMLPVEGIHGVPGINGVHFLGGQLYFTNSAQGLLARIKTGGSGGTDVEVLKRGLVVDDFIFAGDKVYLTMPMNGILGALEVGKEDAEVEVVATELKGPTAVAVGEAGELYVTTTGGIEAYMSGQFTEGGRIVKVEL